MKKLVQLLLLMTLPLVVMASELKEGTLSVLLFSEGKPLSANEVKIDGKKIFKTDKDGAVKIRLHGGRHQIEIFGKNASGEFSEIVFHHLQSDPSEEVRVQASISLIKCKKLIDLNQILACFQQETSDEVKSHIAELIAEVPDKKSVEFLTEALECEEFKLTQAAAAEALHKIARKLGYKDENEMLDSM